MQNLFDYSEVLTCRDMDSILAGAIIQLKHVPWFRPIEKYKLKIAIQIIADIHYMLHKKEQDLRVLKDLEEKNEESY